MNRRELLAGSGGAFIVGMMSTPVLATVSSLGGDQSTDVFNRTKEFHVIWDKASQYNPHALLVQETLVKWAHQDVLCFRGTEMGLDKTIKFTQPKFVVENKGKVWSWMTGFTNEDGLAISIYERDVYLASVGIATNIGYEEYFSDSGKQRDMERYPDYFVRRPYLNYEHETVIEPLLPKGHINYDMSWLEYYKQLPKEA